MNIVEEYESESDACDNISSLYKCLFWSSGRRWTARCFRASRKAGMYTNVYVFASIVIGINSVTVIRCYFVRECHVTKQCFDRRILISFAFAAVKVDRMQLISNCYVVTFMLRLIIH